MFHIGDAFILPLFDVFVLLNSYSEIIFSLNFEDIAMLSLNVGFDNSESVLIPTLLYTSCISL